MYAYLVFDFLGGGTETTQNILITLAPTSTG